MNIGYTASTAWSTPSVGFLQMSLEALSSLLAMDAPCHCARCECTVRGIAHYEIID